MEAAPGRMLRRTTARHPESPPPPLARSEARQQLRDRIEQPVAIPGDRRGSESSSGSRGSRSGLDPLGSSGMRPIAERRSRLRTVEPFRPRRPVPRGPRRRRPATAATAPPRARSSRSPGSPRDFENAVLGSLSRQVHELARDAELPDPTHEGSAPGPSVDRRCSRRTRGSGVRSEALRGGARVLPRTPPSASPRDPCAPAGARRRLGTELARQHALVAVVLRDRSSRSPHVAEQPDQPDVRASESGSSASSWRAYSSASSGVSRTAR